MFPLITPFSIRLDKPDKDYVENDLIDSDDTSPGMPLIANRGFPAVVVSTNGIFYPIGLLINWVFYSALVGAVIVTYKNFRNENRQ